MVIKVNGEPETFAQQQVTVAELLSLKNVEMPEMVSVQLNGEFVERQAFASVKVKDQDEVDFLYFLGGGAR